MEFKWMWVGYKPFIVTDVSCGSLCNPMINPGYNEIFSSIGIDTYYYEHTVIVNDKKLLRYKSKNPYEIKITKFLFWIKIKLQLI